MAVAVTVARSEPDAQGAGSLQQRPRLVGQRAPEVACVLPDIERRQSRWASQSAPMAGTF